MRRHKHRLENFSYCDGPGICRHLERMAARGWYLDEINLLWRYRRAPAQAVRYAVVYCDGAIPFSSLPGDGAQPLVDYCAQAGWTLCAQWRKMLIFSTPLPDPVPMDTDPEVQLEAMHRVMMGWPLLGPLTLGLALLPVDALLLTRLLTHPPVRLLADGLALLGLVLLCLLPLLVLMDPLVYLWWHRKARRAVALGAPRPPFFRWPTAAAAALAGLLIALYEAEIFRDPAEGWPRLLRLLFLLLCVAALCGLRSLLRRSGAQPGFTLAATVAAALILVLVLNHAVDPKLAELSARGVFGGPYTVVTRTSGRTTEADHLRQDPIPLTLQDLTGADRGQWSCEMDRYRSPLLTLTEAGVRAPFEAADRLSYEIMEVRLPALTSAIMDLVMEAHSASPSSRFVPVDAAPWGADEAYQRLWDGQTQPTYLLRSGNTVVCLSLPDDLELTPELTALICEKLFS